MLLSLVLMALYKSAEILRASNKNLFSHLEKTSDALKGSKVLYMDILQSLKSNEHVHHLEIHNSLTHLPYVPLYNLLTRTNIIKSWLCS